jgi:hypothetical protein
MSSEEFVLVRMSLSRREKFSSAAVGKLFAAVDSARGIRIARLKMVARQA